MSKKKAATHIVRMRFDPREASIIMLARALEPARLKWMKLDKVEAKPRDKITMTVLVSDARMRKAGWGFAPGTKKELDRLAYQTLREDAYTIALRHRIPYSIAYWVDPIPF